MRTIALSLAITLLAAAAHAEAGKIKGYMFGDYYWVTSADDADTKAPEKRNAFRFRRLYFTYQKRVAEQFSIRYRLEANDAGFDSGSKMVPFVKHAFLKWSKGVAGSDLYLGLSGTPTWSVSEHVWGYRSIEKTIMDLNHIGSSADLGVGLKGSAGNLGYHLMVGNGPGQKAEDDNGKKLYGQLRFKAGDGLTLVGYGDYSMRPADRNQITFAGFAGLTLGRAVLGVEPFLRINQSTAANGDDVNIAGLSVFGHLPVADQWQAFGRVDVVNNDAADTTDLLVIAGLDYAPAKDIHLMPNLYLGLPDGPDPNIQARVTTFYKF